MQVGVIGTGALGKHHVRLYAACPQADLVGVFDANRALADEVAAQCGTRVFDTVEDLAAACAGLSVVVPTRLHHGISLALLAAGKHVLVEKPLAHTTAEGRELVEMAENRGVVLAVGHVERFSPALAAAEAIPGPVRYLRAQRSFPFPPRRGDLPPRGCEVSIVHDLMIHDLDLCLLWLGSGPITISAFSQCALSGREDFVAARLRFANGGMADLTASRLAPEPVRNLLLAKEAGHVSIDLLRRRASVRRIADGDGTNEPVPVVEANALADELADFCTAATNTSAGLPTRPRVDGRTGLRALELAEYVLEAARSGREMSFTIAE